MSSGWYVPGVDPAGHPSLVGVDTEAAEQIFHIAKRWQTVLSSTNPVHQELFLLIFAWQHNSHHSCDAAVKKYLDVALVNKGGWGERLASHPGARSVCVCVCFVCLCFLCVCVCVCV